MSLSYEINYELEDKLPFISTRAKDIITELYINTMNMLHEVQRNDQCEAFN